MLAVALLRGINVGGKAKVAMPRLRESFEALDCGAVTTYINSGNVLFEAPAAVRTEADLSRFADVVEPQLEGDFGFNITVVMRSHRRLRASVAKIPRHWANDGEHRADVIFLRPEVDRAAVLAELTLRPGVDEAVYGNGLVAWRVPRNLVTRSGLTAIVGTPLYRQVTVRNITTARKLVWLLDDR